MRSGDKQITLSGTVSWYGTHERISGALIKTTSREGKVKLTEADDDGDFPGDSNDVALPSGHSDTG